MGGVCAAAGSCKPRRCGYADTVAAKDSLLAALVVAVVAALVVVGVTPLGVPPPAPERSAADGFSAGRAMVLLREIAAAPRPMGSAGAARARDAIVARARGAASGAARADRRRGVGAERSRGGHGAATWSPGCRAATLRAPSCSSAHYDSVPVAAGAADDGSGVVDAARDGPRAGRPGRGRATTSSSCSPTERSAACSGARLPARGPVGLRRRRRAELRQPGLVVAGAHVRDEPGQRPAWCASSWPPRRTRTPRR